MTVTHRDLCRVAASWALSQSWGWASGFEVSIDGGIADVLAITNPAIAWSPEHEEAHRLWADQWGRAYEAEQAELDTMPIEGTSKDRLNSWQRRREDARRAADVRVPRLWADIADKPQRPRVSVIEVKRTRSDLLSDLRAGKMLAYERTGQACYLAATSEALKGATIKAILADLTARGLPTYWGVVRLTSGDWCRGAVDVGDSTWSGSCIRPARKPREASAGELARAHRWLTRSLSYRAVGGRL